MVGSALVSLTIGLFLGSRYRVGSLLPGIGVACISFPLLDAPRFAFPALWQLALLATLAQFAYVAGIFMFATRMPRVDIHAVSANDTLHPVR